MIIDDKEANAIIESAFPSISEQGKAEALATAKTLGLSIEQLGQLAATKSQAPPPSADDVMKLMGLLDNQPA